MLASLAPVQPKLFEVLLGFETGQAFIPKNDRKIQGLLQLLRKSRNLLALRTLSPIHMQRLPHDNLMDFVLNRKTPEVFNIRLRVFPPERWPGLSGQQQGIADRYADSLVADVERHNPHIFMIPARVLAGL